MPEGRRELRDAARLTSGKILNPHNLDRYGGVQPDSPSLIILAAGKGTRFGQAPKCAQPVGGVPLARHSIDAFRCFSPTPVVAVVGYRHDEVMAALGDENVYIRSDDPAGGTAYAAYEAFCLGEFLEKDPVLILTMGDRIVTSSVFRRLYETHRAGPREADLTLLTAIYEPPKNRGKGRLVRDGKGRVLRIVEQRDIEQLADRALGSELADIAEGNCPLYAIRARTLRRYLAAVSNDNAQGQFYLTDIVEAIGRDGGDIRTVTTNVADPEYDLLCSDVTQPMDLALLEGLLASAKILTSAAPLDWEQSAVQAITAHRPSGQVASIAAQLELLIETAALEKLGFAADQPVGIGVAGGRLRIAFMHPDMGRFFGPAWQMPIGAADAAGQEQIVILVQSCEDRKIHLYPTNPQFREKLNFVDADDDLMYPGSDVADWYTYEHFGTRMAENLLLSLGYFSDRELKRRREEGIPLPPASLWVSTNMRRPFSLIGNAIASMRTLREGNLGARVQSVLGRDRFRGLRLVSTGSIPQGGFASSSAVTVATKNAINALYDLGISPDSLVHLACQAEYGTGVRAGSLDQATEQKGRPGEGALISSNPRDNYRILETFPVPADRFHVLFPYSVDRDREAWQWSWGMYAATAVAGRLTTAEMRKMTGKAAELAAVLVKLPMDSDFFQRVEADLLQTGELGLANRIWVSDVLRKLPLLIPLDELRGRIEESRQWYLGQLIEVSRLNAQDASDKTDRALESLFAGWREPVLRRALPEGGVVEEKGVPLRAMAAYLFAEVAKNFYLVNHPQEWIEFVSRSQGGDRCLYLDRDRLPAREEMMGTLDWERDFSGAALMEEWLARYEAMPFDYNRGLDDCSLSVADPMPLHLLEGTSFFRGLALIDLAEAMLKRAFGADAVAVRVNAAGQGDFFQVHVDTWKADVEEVKQFIRMAFYRRFGLSPGQEFVEPHPGGGAVGVRLSRFDRLPALIRALRVADERG